MNALLSLAALAALGSPMASPLECQAPVAARGEVRGGPPLVHVFELRNVSAEQVTITNVETSCGCLRQNLTANVLPAGAVARLTIEVNTLTQPDGENRWPIRVRSKTGTSDPQDLELLIRAKIVRELILTPPQLALSTTGELTRTLTLTDRRATPLTLIRAESTSPHLKPTIAARQGTTTTITLTVAAEAPAGVRDETVVLYSDDVAYPEFRVPVRVEKRALGSAMLTPDDVVLRFASGEAAASSLVQVRSTDGKPVAIAKVESDHPSVTAKWSTTPGLLGTIRVTAAAPSSPAGRKGRVDLRVHLAEPAGQMLILPVSWTAPE